MSYLLSPCASSSMRLVWAVCSLMSVLLLLPSTAHAGTYWQSYSGDGHATFTSPTRSGTTVYANDDTFRYYHPYYFRDGCGISDGAPGSSATATETFGGSIVITFTWHPDPNLASDPAPVPQSVIVREECTVQFYIAPQQVGSAIGNSSGQVNSVLGPAAVAPGDGSLVVSTGVRYSVGGGASFSVSCSPTMSATLSRSSLGAGGTISSKLAYSAIAYPATITLNGQNSGNQALTGQQITASLSTPNGLPTGTKITSYTWSFDGGTAPNPIKNWDGNGTDPSGKPQQLFPLTAADLTGTDTSGNGISVSPVSFYDQVADTVTVKCAVSLKFSDGTMATVNAKSVPVAFKKPTADWMFTQTTVADQPDKGSFQAGELLGPISITVPSPFSGGSGCLVQLGTFNRSVKRHPLNNQPDTYSYKVQKTNPDGTTSWIVPGQGLDGGFPYAQSITLDSNNNPVVTNNSGGYIWGANDQGTPADTPTQSYTNTSLDSGGNDWYQAHANDSFVDYLMYKPLPFGSQGVIWVPLKTLTWSWNATATKGATGEWKTVGGMTTGQVTDATSPPQWSTVLQAAEQYRP